MKRVWGWAKCAMGLHRWVWSSLFSRSHTVPMDVSHCQRCGRMAHGWKL